MNKSEITKILRRIALENGVSVSEVRKEIQIAIEAAMSNPDPAVQAEWKAMSHNGQIPSPEEVIIYLAEKINKEENTDSNVIKFPYRN